MKGHAQLPVEDTVGDNESLRRGHPGRRTRQRTIVTRKNVAGMDVRSLSVARFSLAISAIRSFGMPAATNRSTTLASTPQVIGLMNPSGGGGVYAASICDRIDRPRALADRKRRLAGRRGSTARASFARRFAASTRFLEMSTPSTSAPRCASGTAVVPSPHPRSRTLIPRVTERSSKHQACLSEHLLCERRLQNLFAPSTISGRRRRLRCTRLRAIQPTILRRVHLDKPLRHIFARAVLQ